MRPCSAVEEQMMDDHSADRAADGAGRERVAASAPDGPARPDAPGPVGPPQSLWWEVAAVLAIGVVPHLMGAIALLCHPTALLPYWLDALNLSVLSGCTIFVTLYLIGRSGEPWDRFGVVWPHLGDVATGGLLFLAAVLLLWQMPAFLWSVMDLPSPPFPQPSGTADRVLMVVKYGLSAGAEEVVTRVYLITRLRDLMRSRGEAVLMSAVLFASYHVYQGLPGFTYSLMFGSVYGIAFLALGRVWPLVLGHSLYNIWVESLTA